MQSEQNATKSSQKGTIYGRLTLTGKSYLKSMYGQLRRIVEADCICGEIGWFLLERLRNGDTQSCGCLKREATSERFKTHGLSRHPLYFVWQEMRKRCFDEKCDSYHNYGGRGITVCDEWADDFLVFYDWCVANGYEEGKSLDRENNDGNYEPNNCRFANRDTQSRNRRTNRNYTAFGETKCLFDWGKDPRSKVTVWALRSRLDRGKWADVEKAITTPQTSRREISRAMKTNRMLTAFGETKCLNAWLEDPRCTVRVDSLRDRLEKGWEDEKAIAHPAKQNKKSG